MFTRIFITITVFLLTTQLISAQKIFQQPRTISQVVGRMNYEQKVWAYKNSSQYIKNIVFPGHTVTVEYPLKRSNSLPMTLSSYHGFELTGTNYLRHLSFFCRQEYNFEKRTNISLRFRIGTLDYTNYLEQKPNAVKAGF